MTGYVYILKCADGSYYTGSTRNLEQRLWQHQNGQGANHTRKHLPVALVFAEQFERIDEAYAREKQIQGWSRKKKEALINADFNQLHELAKCRNESRSGGGGSSFDTGFDYAQPTQPTHPTHPTHPTQPAQSSQPVQLMQPIQATQLTQKRPGEVESKRDSLSKAEIKTSCLRLRSGSVVDSKAGSLSVVDSKAGSLSVVDSKAGSLSVVDSKAGSLSVVDSKAGSLSVVDSKAGSLSVVDSKAGSLSVVEGANKGEIN